jgi:hypothetical protein
VQLLDGALDARRQLVVIFGEQTWQAPSLGLPHIGWAGTADWTGLDGTGLDGTGLE